MTKVRIRSVIVSILKLVAILHSIRLSHMWLVIFSVQTGDWANERWAVGGISSVVWIPEVFWCIVAGWRGRARLRGSCSAVFRGLWARGTELRAGGFCLKVIRWRLFTSRGSLALRITHSRVQRHECLYDACCQIAAVLHTQDKHEYY